MQARDPATVAPRRGAVLAIALVALSLAVAWAHSGVALDHMDAEHGVALCLAATELALGVGLLATSITTPRLRLPRTPGAPVEAPWLPAVLGPGARASPAWLQVFRS
jgi:uncharacterized caspase-like protein